MSWHTVAVVAAILAVVLFFSFQYLNSRLTEPELTAIREAVATGARLVDVRTPQEFAVGHIDGAINIPLGELPKKVKRLGKKHNPIVVYCRSGSRSKRAAMLLRERGFKTVLDMKAMFNWSSVRTALTAG
jgi:phage shock protein E